MGGAVEEARRVCRRGEVLAGGGNKCSWLESLNYEW